MHTKEELDRAILNLYKDYKDTIKDYKDGNLKFLYEVNKINNEEKNVYVLEVYKKRTENVFNEIKIEPEIKNEEKMPDYIPIGLIVGGFLIILFTFWLLFHKKKSR